MLIPDLIKPLLLTVVCELPAAYLLGFRSKLQIISILAINLITNPAVNALMWFNSRLVFSMPTYLLLLILEILVVTGEALLLAFTWRTRFVKMLPRSLLINLTSFLLGLLLLK